MFTPIAVSMLEAKPAEKRKHSEVEEDGETVGGESAKRLEK
jgi:hypothetical protein